MSIKKEIYRYLGYNRIYEDREVDEMVEASLAEIYGMKPFKGVYRNFNIENKSDQIILAESRMVIKSKDLSRYLEDADQIVLMAATLGAEVDRKIHYYSKVNLTKSLVFNACANAVIEEVCDELQMEISGKMATENLCITDRFSPGYGDFEISQQAQLVELLDAYRKIGLSVTADQIMIPRKSVTAIIGVQQNKKEMIDRCKLCNQNDNCEYRGRGIFCGNKRSD